MDAYFPNHPITKVFGYDGCLSIEPWWKSPGDRGAQRTIARLKQLKRWLINGVIVTISVVVTIMVLLLVINFLVNAIMPVVDGVSRSYGPTNRRPRSFR